MKKLLLLLLLLPLFSQAQIITTVAGCGIGDDSVATAAELFFPTGVAVDTFGNVYIADENNERVRKINTSGIITTFAGTGIVGYNGDGGAATAAQLFDPSGVTVDKAGNVYISDAGNNRIRKVNTSGIITTLAGTGTAAYSGDGGPATAAAINSPDGLSFDTSGNLYFADGGNGRIRKISTAGIITTVAGNGGAGYGSDGLPATATALNHPYDVVPDTKGNFYIADWGNNRVRKVNAAGIITTAAGTGVHAYSGDGGPATAAEVRYPTGVALDTAGNLYIADLQNFRIRKIDTAGIIITIAGNGTVGNGGDGGPATAAQLSEPNGLAIDNQDNIYIADDWNNRVRKVTAATGTITTIAGRNGLFGEGFAALNAELSVPDNVAVDTAGNVYVVDFYNNRIREINATTGIINTVCGAGIAGAYDAYSGDGGPADSAHIDEPTAVAVDAIGNIYVADADNERIRKVNTSGIVTTIAGTGVGGYSGDGGAATAAEISNPEGIAVDNNGNVYIADEGNYRIRKINSLGIISTVAGNGTAGYTGDGGPATAERIYPYDVAVDETGNIYIADGGNNRIRKIDATGIIYTIAGNGTMGTTGDGGPATSAEVYGPGAVKVDGVGNVYINDYNRIRMIDTSGIITTIAGNGSAGYTGDGGIATAAELNGPAGIAIDRSGNVYIADFYNYRIRKVTGSLGIPPINKAAGWNVSVYPNPASTLLTISASVNINNITITNIVGQTVSSQSYNSSQIQVDVSSLPTGIYFVKVNNTDGSAGLPMTKKFVKE